MYWAVFFEIEIVDNECEPHVFERKFQLPEGDSQYLAYKLAVDEGERIIKKVFPGGYIGRIEMI